MDMLIQAGSGNSGGLKPVLFKECCYQFLVSEGLCAAWAQS